MDVVGTWHLVSVSAEGRPAFGARPTGRLVYTAEGTVAAFISHGGRAQLSRDDRMGAPEQERAAAFASFLAYAGRYTVGDGCLVHHVEIASVENWVGRDLVRFAELDGPRLTLRTPPLVVGGRERVTELVWERATPG
jgi:hypothetical protein